MPVTTCSQPKHDYAIGTRVRVVKFCFAMNKYLVVTNAGQQFYVPREYFSLEAPAASSHFNGVRSSKTSGKWEARIQHEGKTHQIGTFDDEIEAAKARLGMPRRGVSVGLPRPPISI